MLRQLTLFQQAGRRRATVAHLAGSQTSAQAAVEIRPHAQHLRQGVMAYLIGRGSEGATDSEIQAALGINGDTQRPRRVELVRDGLVKDSGATRKTSSGRQAVVWVAATQAQGGTADGGSNAAIS